jgi:ubiquinone/menaquinone biosynthesis C-methylase UbiE
MDCEARICDYEDSAYRTDFWEGQGREYEDLAERIALHRLLPAAGRRLLDIGAGFGRLSKVYGGYEQVVLLDYSRSLLREAQERLGRDDRILYVAGSFYALPFQPGTFDAAMMVRVMHHVEQVPVFLEQLRSVLATEGSFVLEFANKRHLKSILRYIARRQVWSPFDQEPYEFLEMNLDFHPTWMASRLAEAGFHVKRRLTVSHFRMPVLKRLIPARVLATVDGLLQPTGRWWQLTPSVFFQCAKEGPSRPFQAEPLFRCPVCDGDLDRTDQGWICRACGRLWPIEDGIHDFKSALRV